MSSCSSPSLISFHLPPHLPSASLMHAFPLHCSSSFDGHLLASTSSPPPPLLHLLSSSLKIASLPPSFLHLSISSSFLPSSVFLAFSLLTCLHLSLLPPYPTSISPSFPITCLNSSLSSSSSFILSFLPSFFPSFLFTIFLSFYVPFHPLPSQSLLFI